jgi:hypothetical protein
MSERRGLMPIRERLPAEQALWHQSLSTTKALELRLVGISGVHSFSLRNLPQLPQI